MNGDFSQSNGHLSPLRIEPENNFSGVLHQQGRVLLDSDWNEQTAITTRWQDQAGRDVIGPGVAAVPAGEPDGFRVESASVTSGQVNLTVEPGRVWADGLLAYLPGKDPNSTADVSRLAKYLEPPIQDPAADVSTIKDGERDAVVLEVWREALNGFQEPVALIEPALGGPDTTERVLTVMRFRLFRLKEGETCRSIATNLRDNFGKKGKLRVTIQPPTAIQGDCPVEEAGGYTGFEHLLYRIEIAQVNVPQNPPAMFKWSQFNGGLVGRGDCDLAGTNKKITIKANDQAIKMSGLSSFYLEVMEFDDAQGSWRVTYGAKATLNGNDLEVTQEHYTETARPSGNVFFRLWNDIRRIDGTGGFPKATAPAKPNELRDGIHLEFDSPGPTNYQPGDYWTFEVRAGGIDNSLTLIDDEPPQGIHYHRVPLAILKWNAAKNVSFQQGQIEDCRDIFWPLTGQRTGCCSFTVGDGVSSHGDFDSIEEAIRHLPATGGDVCLLPGVHEAGVALEDKIDIKIRGCDKRTTLIPSPDDREGPIFRIVDSRGITLERMDLITYEGTAVVVEGTAPGDLRDVTIRNNRILAYENGVRAVRASNVDIRDNKINVLDKEGAGAAVYVMAEDSVIEWNSVSVVPAEASPTPPEDDVDEGEEELPNPTDPCADLEAVYGDIAYVVGYANFLWEAVEILAFQVPENPFSALGGIQIAGGSERIRVLENRVWGGAGNGVALGGGLGTGTPDPQDPADPEFTIEHRQEMINGWAEVEGKGIKGVVVYFEGSDGRTLRVTTGDHGSFTLGAPPGEYKVSVGPGHKLEGIETIDDPEFGRFFRLGLVEEEVDPPGELAFMYEIRIDGNEISGMGLSGIGIPRTVGQEDFRAVGLTSRRALFPGFAEVFARLGNPVVNLAIHGNHIFGCLQNPFDPAMRAEARLRGFGGVALGMCGNLSMRENRIENNGAARSNGTRDVNPVCGVYVAYVERVDVAHNEITNNGSVLLGPDIDLDVIPGIRGGVVLTASFLPILGRLTERREALPGARPASPAARIHDNVVEQPAGQALRVTAIGPVSVQGNHFSSELSGPEYLDLLAGAVLIQNIWNMSNVFARATSVRGLANSNTLFNGNQTSVGPNNSSSTSQLILSIEDIGFDGNQSDNLKGGFLLSNTLLLGATLRASDNRLKEVVDGDEDLVFTSLLTLTGLLNNTTNNQGNHCIIAFNQDSQRPAIEAGNEVLPAGAGQCQARNRLILENGDTLILAILRALGMLRVIR